MRKLASICTIENVIPMYNKDLIASVSFIENGYEAIIPKKEAIKGNLMAFIQEGSILPVKPEWEFLRKRCFNEKENGFIIKPMTMGKKDNNGEPGERVRSWGLAVAVDELPLEPAVRQKLKSGDDITELLEIRKYEPEEEASPTMADTSKGYPAWVKFCLKHKAFRWIGKIWQKKHPVTKGGFPTTVISKSDETTIQNMKIALEKYKDELVYTSCKIEGQSVTALFGYDAKRDKLINHDFYVCGRNTAYKHYVNNDYWNTAKSLDIENKLRKYYKRTGKALVLQSEQVGPGIQNNIYNLKSTDWYVYTIKDEVTGKQLELEEMEKVCRELGLKTVPIIEKNVRLGDIMPDLDTAVTYAENRFWRPIKSEGVYGPIDPFYKPRKGEELWKDYFQHEGVVVRSMNYDKDANIGVSFKVKNCSYQEQKLGTISANCRALLSK